MRILITGTTGGIGGAVKAAALAAGHEVTEVNRGEFDGPLGEGVFDACVFSTGTCPIVPLAQLADAALLETFAVNCGLFVKLVRRLVTERRANPAGMRVVAISSVSAVEGWPGGVAYCASKGALSAAARALAAELAPRRISVEALEPRYVRTRMFARSAGRMGVSESLALDPAAFATEVLARLGSRP